MMLNESNERFEALVVGRPDMGRARAVTILLERLGIDHLFCDDVYAAVAQLAGIANHRSVLMVSALEEIAAEKMRFFDICRARGNVRIICFANLRPQTARRADCLRRERTLIIQDLKQLKPLIETLIGDFDACCLNPRQAQVNYAGCMDPGFATRNEAVLSRAELNALLGGD